MRVGNGYNKGGAENRKNNTLCLYLFFKIKSMKRGDKAYSTSILKFG